MFYQSLNNTFHQGCQLSIDHYQQGLDHWEKQCNFLFGLSDRLWFIIQLISICSQINFLQFLIFDLKQWNKQGNTKIDKYGARCLICSYPSVLTKSHKLITTHAMSVFTISMIKILTTSLTHFIC